jgi:predicted histone-like DNA-binding protein
MIEFEVKSRVMNIGKRKGQTLYYASPKSNQRLTNKMVVDRIVRETSLSAGDVSNALISLGAIVRDALLMGASVDLADLGSFRVIAPPTMVDKEIDVTAATLKTPKIVFTPKMQMRDSAKSVELVVDNPKRRKQQGTQGENGSGEDDLNP